MKLKLYTFWKEWVPLEIIEGRVSWFVSIGPFSLRIWKRLI